MKITAKTKIWSDDELLTLHSSGERCELWNGKVVTMSPAGANHGDLISRLLVAVGSHVYEHNLGLVYEGQTGFRLNVDYCYSPDISYVSHERRKLILPLADKLFQGAPDLAVEVLSPSDSITKTEEKLARLLTHGTRLAWMVDHRHFSVRVYRKPDEFELLRPGRYLTGNSVLPGFRFPVARLFQDPNFA